MDELIIAELTADQIEVVARSGRSGFNQPAPSERAVQCLEAIRGTRLTYRRTDEAANA